MKRPRVLRWLHKDIFSIAVVALALLLVVMLGISLAQKMMQPKTTLRLGDGIFTTYVAATNETRTKGLGGTKPLEPNQALLMVFDRDAKWSIWMKDVSYPIDVVWVDANKRVVHIVKNMPPDSYPDQFTPEKPARFVFEFPAGTVERKAIKVGAEARFNLDQEEGRL
jgi:uncharacterized membrane protein (UPF0127 family)